MTLLRSTNINAVQIQYQLYCAGNFVQRLKYAFSRHQNSQPERTWWIFYHIITDVKILYFSSCNNPIKNINPSIKVSLSGCCHCSRSISAVSVCIHIAISTAYWLKFCILVYTDEMAVALLLCKFFILYLENLLDKFECPTVEKFK